MTIFYEGIKKTLYTNPPINDQNLKNKIKMICNHLSEDQIIVVTFINL